MNTQASRGDIAAFDVARIRAGFPILSRQVHGKPLVYFDNANTSQKPIEVIDTVDRFYRETNANVARAVHSLGEAATSAYEGARDKIARFINAPTRDEVIFTSGTTQAMNTVAYSYAMPRLQPGDEILVTTMEHHANIVPWQLVAARTGAKVIAAPITQSGELIVEEFIARLNPRVKLAGVTHVSNVLGTINPIRELAKACRARGIPPGEAPVVPDREGVPAFPRAEPSDRGRRAAARPPRPDLEPPHAPRGEPYAMSDCGRVAPISP